MKYEVGQIFSYNTASNRYRDFTLVEIRNGDSYKFRFTDYYSMLQDWVVWSEKDVDRELTLVQVEDFEVEFSV